MRTTLALIADGTSDTGLQRDVNEDRFHVNAARGIFAVIDGVGGQAAGGKAADVALAMLRHRLERETGPVGERIREAITIANNEIFRLASTRAEWNNMACVLTVAVVDPEQATVGHVGDTRLYKLRNGRIEKVTRDHSPVGEREDAHELSESDAMRHPRRNEVYRDVGSEPHQPDDPEFVDIERVPFESDCALLLCSDGLTDLVPSDRIQSFVHRHAGDPQAVVRTLVAAANEAGGKDNVTVVYVEAEGFARDARRRASDPAPELETRDGHRESAPQSERRAMPAAVAPVPDNDGWAGAALLVLALLLVVAGLVVSVMRGWLPLPANTPIATVVAPPVDVQVVRAGESINAAIERARPGSQVIVEPGEYREHVRLKSQVRVVSRVPREATIRLPAAASESEPAVLADSVSAAEFIGFRIVGDAATPLGVGLFIHGSSISVSDIEITGATKMAIDIAGGSAVGLVGSAIRDNPGAALAIRAGATPRISQNMFVRNSLSAGASMPLVIEPGAVPEFAGNVFYGIRADAFPTLDPQARRALARENWFVALSQPARPAAAVAGARQGR